MSREPRWFRVDARNYLHIDVPLFLEDCGIANTPATLEWGAAAARQAVLDVLGPGVPIYETPAPLRVVK